MSDMGDLKFLDEMPLSDLSWLDIDKDEYRRMERLPKQNLDAIPELQEHWKDLSDEESFRLSPENRMPENPHTPFWSERPHFGELSDSQVETLLSRYARKHLQAGATTRQVVSSLRQNFEPKVLARHKEALKEAMGDRGILGSVYLDAELFPKCHNGGIAKDLTTSNQHAPLVLAKSSCIDCRHNKEGRCAVFKKDLVFDVNYNEELWDTFKNRVLDRDLTGLDKLPVKARIREAMRRPRKAREEGVEAKPVHVSPSQRVSLEQAKEALSKASTEQEVIANPALLRKRSHWARLMMASPVHTPKLVDKVATDPDLQPLKKHLHLLGPLYADLSYFDNYKEAASFLKDLDAQPPVWVGSPRTASSFDSRKAHLETSDLTQGRLLKHVLNRFLVASYGGDAETSSVNQKRFDRLWEHFQGKSAREVRRFAQKVYAKPVAASARVYEGMHFYDPTQGISEKEALRRLANHKPETVEVVGSQTYRERQRTVIRMLLGQHTGKVANVIARDKYMQDLEQHRYLLGELYVDTSLVGETLLGKLAKRRPKLKHLPQVDAESVEDFLTSHVAYGAIAQRMSAVKGLKDRKATLYMRSVISKIQDWDAAQIRALAKDVFSRPVVESSSVAAESGTALLDEFEMGRVASAPALEFDVTDEPDTPLEFTLEDAGMSL